jgi:ABC-type transporter Mla MlaB component
VGGCGIVTIPAVPRNPTVRMSGLQRDADPGAIVLTISGALARADIPALCERLRTVLLDRDHQTDAVICDLAGIERVDAVTIDALARLQLTARRLGRRLLLRNASADVQTLLALMGLAGVVPLEPQRQVEQREQLCGIEEERDPADPAL